MSSEEPPGDATELGTDHKGRRALLREDEVERTFDTMVVRGRPRLFRTFPELVASGIIAGVEIALGILAFLSVEQATGSQLLAGLAFGAGFLTLLLGNSELFTEGFMVPLAVVLAREAGWWRLVRFWMLTLFGNLVGGWFAMWMVITAFPELRSIAVETGAKYAESEVSLQTLLLSVLAGSTMTLLTRMRLGTNNDMARVVASIAVAFLVAGMGLFHSVLDTLFIFGGVQAGGDYTYLDWLGFFGWAVLGNALGGIGITAFLRLLRSHVRVAEWRRNTPISERP